MLKRLTIAFVLVLLCELARAQGGPGKTNSPNTVISTQSGAPSGSCSTNQVSVDTANGDFYTCPSGSWVKSGVGGSSVSQTGLTAGSLGQPIYSNGAASVTTSPALFDVSILEPVGVGDGGARLGACETAASTGITCDARGVQGTVQSALNPFTATSVSDVLLGNAIYQIHQTWCTPNKITVTGLGWDKNPATGTGATTLQATSDLAIGGAHPGPIQAWGNPTNNCLANVVVQNTKYVNLEYDCNNVPTTAVQAFNPQEDSGLDRYTIVNCGGGGANLASYSMVVGAPPQLAAYSSVSLANNTTTLTCTAACFDPSDVGAQFTLATATVKCIAASPCFISSIQSTTSATISTTYTGTTVTNQQLTWGAANAQNSDFQHGNIGLTTLAGSCPTSGNAPGALLVMNTGSGSNMGPRVFDDITLVINCVAGGAIPPAWLAQISGTGFNGRAWHMEDGNLTGATGGLDIGLDSTTTAVDISGVTCGNMLNSTDCVRISNANANTAFIRVANVKTVPANNPTNTLADQVSGNTIASATEGSLSEYILGKNSRVVTSASSVPESNQQTFTGFGVGGTLVAATTYSVLGLGGSSLTFNANTTSPESVPIPSAGVLTSLSVICGTGPAVGHTDVWTVQVNSVASSLTCSITGAGAQSCQDTTPGHAKTVVALNLLKVTVLTDAASTTTADCRVTVTKE